MTEPRPHGRGSTFGARSRSRGHSLVCCLAVSRRRSPPCRPSRSRLRPSGWSCPPRGRRVRASHPRLGGPRPRGRRWRRFCLRGHRFRRWWVRRASQRFGGLRCPASRPLPCHLSPGGLSRQRRWPSPTHGCATPQRVERPGRERAHGKYAHSEAHARLEARNHPHRSHLSTPRRETRLQYVHLYESALRREP